MGFAYKTADAAAVYFITCTVNKWVDIFTRKIYTDIVINSLNHCTENKGLIIYGYVIMLPLSLTFTKFVLAICAYL